MMDEAFYEFSVLVRDSFSSELISIHNYSRHLQDDAGTDDNG